MSTTTHHTHTEQLAGVPPELTALRQWVVWRIEHRDGKDTKVPYRAAAPARRASSTDPSSWASYADAVAAWSSTPGLDGVGFVFTEDDPYCGIDLDASLGDGGELREDTAKLVAALDSYAELSPSGQGVHIIVRGELPGGKGRKIAHPTLPKPVELYDRSRFFTMTGRQLPGAPAQIADRQPAVDELLAIAGDAEPATAPAGTTGSVDLDDQQLLDKARAAANGDKFTRLYDAGDTEGYASRSEAEAALVSLLVWWTNRDPHRVDQLYRQSALMRDKWDRSVGGGDTYGQRTISTAMAKYAEGYDPERAKLEPAMAEDAPRPLVHGPTEGTAERNLSDVVATFRKWLELPDDPASVLVPLGVAQANRMAGDPVWLLDIEPPSWGKTERLQPIAGSLREAHMVSTLTEAALLSGTSRKERGRDSTGGLLRTVGEYGILIVKDFTSILSMHREQRAATIAALREVYDGHWSRNVGTDGGKTLEWRGKVGLIAGCTEVYDKHYGVIGAMGDRFLVHRPLSADPEAVAERALDVGGHEPEMRRELTEAVAGLFAGMPFGLVAEPLERGSTARQQLIDLARIATQARSTVDRDDYSREIESVHNAEGPPRLLKGLAQLRSGLLAIGVPLDDAHRYTAMVALDSIPQQRRRLLSNLAVLGPHARVMTKDAAMDLGLPVRTTERVLEDLAAQGMVIHTAGGKGAGNAATWHMASSWHELWARSVPSGL